MGKACSAHGGVEIRVRNVFVRKPEEKSPLGRSRHRREDNIKVDVESRRGG